jgi:hypothetical protein
MDDLMSGIPLARQGEVNGFDEFFVHALLIVLAMLIGNLECGK